MKIIPERFKVDESRSNPMVIAMQYPDCPTNDICAYMAVGFGSVMNKCLFFSENGVTAECTKDHTTLP